MRNCEGCGTEIDSNDGVTVVPAKSGNSDDAQWWHPDCRAAELRKRVAAAQGRTPVKPSKPTKGKPVVARVDDDDEV